MYGYKVVIWVEQAKATRNLIVTRECVVVTGYASLIGCVRGAS